MPVGKIATTLLISALIPLVTCLSVWADTSDATASAQPVNVEVSADSTLAETTSAETVEPLYPMSAERKANLIAYSKFKNMWRFAEFFIGLGILALILFSGFSAKLRNWAGAGRRKFFVLWLFLGLFMITDYLLSFPFHVYRGFFVESQYGFMNQSFGAWLGEDLLGLLIGMVIGIVPLWLLYFVIEKSKKWWLWFSLGAIPLAILLIVVAPVVISPLFNKFEPLKDKALEAEILALADQVGIEGSNVFQVNASKQSSKINAYVTGLFGSKRIVLYDTMIDNFTTDEIRFVMGHEMAHYLMNHIWKGLAVAILFIALALWLTDKTIHAVIRRFSRRFRFDRLSDIASLPLILVFLTLISFLFEPVVNGYSRYHERQSDKYAMDITGVSGEAAATAFDKLSVFNLSDPDPHPVIEFWFYSHPALSKRMSFVRNYRP